MQIEEKTVKSIMRKRAAQVTKKSAAKVYGTGSSAIQPFAEQPGDDRFKQTKKEKKDIGASELFSLFTADIIKEETIFTR